MTIPFDEKPRSHRRGGEFLKVATGFESYQAFLPSRLPPEPPLDMSRILTPLERANQAIGRLDGISSLLPDLDCFLFVHIRKEALLSSQIEGIESSLPEILKTEIARNQGSLSDDILEIRNYVAAVNEGLKQIRQGLPFSIRLIKDIHRVLFSTGPGSNKLPGEFRKTQNWIGGSSPRNAVFVPPPPHYIPDLVSDIESYYHEFRARDSVLLLIGMIHAQFETVHPFLDGNGRTGRMLITLQLCAEGIIQEPVLYPSLFFKTHRHQYYELLRGISSHGNWEDWLIFYLEGIYETARAATTTMSQALDLFAKDRASIRQERSNTGAEEEVLERFQRSPIQDVSSLHQDLDLAKPTIRRALTRLVNQAILSEVTGRQRFRVYVYREYMRILEHGTEPLQ